MFDIPFLQARLITSEDETPNKPIKQIILPAKNAPTTLVASVNLNFTTLSTDRDGKWSVMEYTLPAHSSGAPIHRHIKADEAYYVLEGQPLFHFENDRIESAAGSLVFVPKGTAHTFSNPSGAPARVLIFVRAAGMERGGSVPIAAEVDLYGDFAPYSPCA